MAVTWTSTSTPGTGGGATTLTSGSLNASAGTDQCLVAGTCSSTATAVTPTGITWDVPTPENLTSVASNTEGGFFGCSLFRIVGFTQATDTVTATWSSAPDESCITVHEFEGVDQTTPIGNTGVDQNTGNATVTVSLTGVTSNDMCIDSLGTDTSDGTPVPAVGANQTERTDIESVGTYSMNLNMSTQAGSDGGVMTYSNTDANANQVYCAAVIKAAAVSGLSIPVAMNSYRQRHNFSLG